MEPTFFICSVCKETKPINTSGGTGYGLREDRKTKVCYDCCGKEDLASLKTFKKMTFYYNETTREITNWPGTLKIIATSHTVTKKKVRICTVFFKDPFGNSWKGIQKGDDNTILKCTKI